MDCKILQTIKADFTSLWKCDVRGKTVVITTPFSHAFSSLINIYLTERDKQFVISDGGDLYRVVTSQDMNWERIALQKAVGLFMSQFEIRCSRVKNEKDAVPMYYMKASNPDEISSALFNIAHFIMAVADFAASLISPVEEEAEEKQNREAFERETAHFLKQTYEEKHTIDFNKRISKFTPSVIIDAKHSIQYISGEQPRTFGGDAGRASLIYQGVQQLRLIETFIAYVDDYAAGFKDDQNQQFIEMLTMDKVYRSQKQNILDLIPV